MPDRVLPGGVAVRAAFAHRGAARRLVHRLKYRPVEGIAGFFAAAMARVAAGEFDVVVPIPRASLRRRVSGRDPAADLAGAIGDVTGAPVTMALRAPLWWPRHAGAKRRSRHGITFQMQRRLTGRVLLVDDVFTTGATVRSALRAIPASGSALVVTATSAGRMIGG